MFYVKSTLSPRGSRSPRSSRPARRPGREPHRSRPRVAPARARTDGWTGRARARRPPGSEARSPAAPRLALPTTTACAQARPRVVTGWTARRRTQLALVREDGDGWAQAQAARKECAPPWVC